MKVGKDLRLAVNEGSQGISLVQVHGGTVAMNPSGGEEADGMVLERGAGLPLLRVADCLPVFAVWKGYTGAAHAGWRGLSLGIVEELLTAVDLPLEYLILGPCICPGCYQVGEEVREAVAQGDPAGLSGHPEGRVDLRGSALRRARMVCGNSFELVSDSRCTLETEGLFSHRQNRTRNRNLVRLAETSDPEHIHRPFPSDSHSPERRLM